MNVWTRFRRVRRALVALVLLLGQSAAMAAVAGPRCASLHAGAASVDEAAGSPAQAHADERSDDLPHDHAPAGPGAPGVSSCTVTALAASQAGSVFTPGETTLPVAPASTILPTSASTSPPYRPPRI